MPDVGVLNLQIQDNSEKAVNSLGNLVDALSRVREAVRDGLKLSSVATGIKKIGEAVGNISGQSITKLGQLATELEKLKGLGSLNIKINGGSSIENIRDAIMEAQTSMGGINTGFEEIGARAVEAGGIIDGFNGTVRETEQLMQNRAWAGGVEQFRQLFEAMNRLRMMYSLPAGQDNAMSTDVDTGWTSWKDGAIEVEGTVSDACESVSGYLEGAQLRLTGVAEEMGKVETATEGAAQKLDYYFDIYTGRMVGTPPVFDTTKRDLEMAETKVRRFTYLQERFANSSDRLKERIAALNGYKVEELWPKTDGASRMEDLMGMDKIGLMTMQMDGMKQALMEDMNANKLNQQQIAERALKIENLREKIEKLRQAQTDETASAKENVSVFAAFKSGVERMFPTLTGMIKRLGQIAKYRLLRAVIKHISEGFREGVENVYHYSAAVGTSFAPAMDQAATALQQMKNSLGAMAAPLIQSLVPVLQTVVNWFIDLVNYANQFFALINGQSTWTRALPEQANAFEKSAKSAKGAGKAMKDLLADWDELNIIQSESGGGAGSGAAKTAEEYKNMFEEVGTFDSNVRDMVEFIRENFDQILGTAEAIGATMLAWKFTRAFSDTLPILSKIIGGAATLGTVVVTVALSDMFGKQYVDSGEPGWLIADALTGALGATIAGAMARKIAGNGSFGLVTAGATLILSGYVNLENAVSASAQQKDAEWGMLTMLSSVETGVGAALIAKGIGLSGAFSFGLGAAAAVGIVAISLGAKIEMSKYNVDYGSVSLSAAEVQQFVEKKMFKDIDIHATVNLISATISNVSADAENIRKQVSNMMPTINSLRLGIDKKASYEELKKQIFGDESSGTAGLISSIQTYAKDNVTELKTAFAIVPVINQAGEDVSASYLESGITGWSEVTAYVNKLGVELGNELAKGFTKDGLANFDEEAVREIMDKMVKISQIITGSQIEASALGDLSMGLSDLSLNDLNKDSIEKVASLFDTYTGELEKEYTQIYKESANQYLTLSRYYSEMGNQGLADFYKQQYDDLIERMPTSVADAVRKASGAGYDMLSEYIHDKFSDVLNRVNLNLEDGGSGFFYQWFGANFTPTEGDIEKSAKDFNESLKTLLGNENPYLAQLFSQMPNLNVWDILTGDEQSAWNEFLRNLLDGRYGEGFADKLVAQYGHDIEEATENATIDYSGLMSNFAESALSGKDKVVEATAQIEITKVDVGMSDQALESTKEQLRADIQSAMVDGIDMNEHDWLINTYGAELFNQVFDELGYAKPWEGFGTVKPVMPAGATPAVNYLGANGNAAQAPGTVTAARTDEQEVTNTAQGVQRGNSEMVAALNALLSVAQAINQKEFTINLNPTGTAGNWVENALNARSRTTGD